VKATMNQIYQGNAKGVGIHVPNNKENHWLTEENAL